MASDGPVGALADGAHVCCFFDSDEEQQAHLTRFLDEELACGHKVVCVSDAASTRRAVDAYLADPVAEAAAASGQLVVRRSDEVYLAGGAFDPDDVIECWSRESEQALADGYPGVRVTGDVTFSVREVPGVERLVEYELALSGALAGKPFAALCQYDRRRLRDGLLAQARSVHRDVAGPLHPVRPETFRVLRDAPGTLRLLGELDMSGTPALCDALRAAVVDGARELVIDLDGLQFLDARGAAALCRPSVEHGVRLELRNPRPIVTRVLSILGDDRLPGIRIHSTPGR